MFPIATNTVTSATTYAAVFNNIPQTFQHLEIRIFARGTNVGANSVLIQINADTANLNYNTHVLSGNGSSVSSSVSGASTFWNGVLVPGSDATSGIYGASIFTILDYTSTVKNKVFRQIGGYDLNGSGAVDLRSGIYFNSTISAINNISFYMANAAVGTRVDLYGISTSSATGA
jgi:hypothetical protein